MCGGVLRLPQIIQVMDDHDLASNPMVTWEILPFKKPPCVLLMAKPIAERLAFSFFPDAGDGTATIWQPPPPGKRQGIARPKVARDWKGKNSIQQNISKRLLDCLDFFIGSDL